MATINSTTTTTGNDAAYVSENHLADVALFISSAMRLIERTDGEAYTLLEFAIKEICAAQDYLEAMNPIESPISEDVAAMLGRVGKPH
jgi:hypothetical protein